MKSLGGPETYGSFPSELHRQGSPEVGSKPPLAYWLGIVLLALLVGSCYFTGLEWHPNYAGAAIQSLERDSFQGDEFMSRSRPTVMSLLYKVIIPAIGRLWLDDRFLLLVNILMALAGLLGLDRIFLALGIRSPAQRFIILTLLSYYHPTLNSIAFVISPFELNPTSVAKPFSIWMVYFAIAERKPWKWMVMGVILASISARNAWMPWTLCLVLHTGRLPAKVQWALYGSAALAALAILLTCRQLMAPSDGSWNDLWAALMAHETSEIDPFWDPALGNWTGTLGFLAICFALLLIRLPEAGPRNRMRRMAVLMLVTWFVGGAYCHWSPRLLQVPSFALLGAPRGLWLPEVIAYGALAGWAMLARPKIGVMGSVAAVTALMAMPVRPKMLIALLGLLALAGAACQVLRSHRVGARLAASWPWMGRLRQGALEHAAEFVLLPALLGLVIVFSGYVHCGRAAAFKTLWKTGVLGDNPMTARWIGVAEYLHRETPANAKVLAMCWARDGYSRCDYREIPADEVPTPDDLIPDGAIRTRSGRASPVPGNDERFYVSFQRHLEMRQRWKALLQFGKAWQAHDAGKVRQLAQDIGGWPDYIVAPASVANWSQGQIPYRYLQTVGDYVVFQRQEGT